MAPSNAAAESSAPGARDEEDDDDADGATDGTKSNDAEGKKQRRELRRLFASKILGAFDYPLLPGSSSVHPRHGGVPE